MTTRQEQFMPNSSRLMSPSSNDPRLSPLHQKALYLSREHQKIEGQLVEVLNEIDQTKFYKKLNYTSLFLYAVGALELTEAVAYAFIAVARKSREVPALKAAILKQKLSVAKASRMVSAMTKENAAELVAYATTHSNREMEQEIARICPRPSVPDKVRVISATHVRLEANLEKNTMTMLKRAQSVLSSRKTGAASFDATLAAALCEYLKRHDPVKKAERARLKIKTLKSFCANRVEDSEADRDKVLIANRAKDSVVNKDKGSITNRGKDSTASKVKYSTPKTVKNYKVPPRKSKRVPLTAYQKHTVFARDKGKCTYVDASGKYCGNDRWLHIHHLRLQSQGGNNDPTNLTTLCAAHHDLVHQMSLPIEGQVTWLRTPRVLYKPVYEWTPSFGHTLNTDEFFFK